MGVRGLQSFLKHNETILTKREKICNTNLVVDCNNLQLYLMSRTQPKPTGYCTTIYDSGDGMHGGNLISYSASVRRYFEVLTKCSLTPIFVVEGSSEVEAIRMLEAVGFKLSESNPQPAVPGIFEVAFRNIAKEFGFKIEQATYGADTVITRLANNLKCPVLAGADLILRSLPGGLINFEQIPIGEVHESDHLICSVWRREYLLSNFPGFEANKLPLLRVLLDDRTSDLFRPISETIAGKYTGGNIHELITFFMRWLSKRPYADTLKYIFELVKHDNREHVEKFTMNLLDTYRQDYNEDLKTVLVGIYTPKLCPSGDQDGAQVVEPAQYLFKVFNDHYISKAFLNMILGESIYENECIYNSSWSSSPNRLKLRIYSIMAALLRPSLPDSQVKVKLEDPASDSSWLRVFTRKYHSVYDEAKVEPMAWLDNYGLLEYSNCYNLVQMSEAERKRLLMAAFRFTQSEFDELKSIVSKKSTNEAYIYDLVISALLIKYISIETNSPPNLDSLNAVVLSICHRYPEEHSSASVQYAAKLFEGVEKKVEELENKYPYRSELRANSDLSTNNLRVAFEAFASLNGLLDGILPQPRPDRWFNGPLLCKLTVINELEPIDLPADFKSLCLSIIKKLRKFKNSKN